MKMIAIVTQNICSKIKNFRTSIVFLQKKKVDDIVSTISKHVSDASYSIQSFKVSTSNKFL